MQMQVFVTVEQNRSNIGASKMKKSINAKISTGFFKGVSNSCIKCA